MNDKELNQVAEDILRKAIPNDIIYMLMSSQGFSKDDVIKAISIAIQHTRRP